VLLEHKAVALVRDWVFLKMHPVAVMVLPSC